jgi:UDP-2-acetamido-2-deoxy-ribo-hexuluronate aminotransferase
MNWTCIIKNILEIKMIRYVDLGVNESEYDNNIAPLIKQVFLSGQFVSNDKVEEFETNFASYCGSKYAVALNSGTDALIFALKSLGIKQGDEVITVSNSFIATANAIEEVGATPIFVDIYDDLLMDVSKIKDAITDKTKAILPVHLMGCVCDMDAIIEIAKEYNIPIVEDAAQSVGSKYKEKKTGTFGKIGCFSLHPLKNLSGVTDGGIITTDDEDIAKQIKQLRNHGLIDRDSQNIIGRVSRLNSIDAVVLNYRLQKLAHIIERRREVAKLYETYLERIDGIKLIEVDASIFHTYHTYIIKAQNRDELASYLLQKGIETKMHYPILIHKQKPFQKYKVTLANTEKLALEILTLPIANLSDSDTFYICKNIADFYKEN